MADLKDTKDVLESVTITLSREDLRLVRSALEEFLASFSHDQGNLLIRIKSLLERLPDGTPKSTGRPPFRRLTL
ncbi:MAG: hypothetical protein ACREOS_10320 [Candidatus Dormibacteraceae bacterium]